MLLIMYTVPLKLLHAGKILRTKNSIGDMPPTWNLHNLSLNSFTSSNSVFIRFIVLIYSFCISPSYLYI